MDYIEVTGKTLDEALTNGLLELQTSSDNVEYEIIDKGTSGVLGLFGTKPAKIRIRKKEEVFEEYVKPAEKEEVKEVVKARPKPVNIDSEAVTKAATTFLTDVCSAMGIEAKVEVTIDKEEGDVNINLSGKDMGTLIGKRGQTLDSLQYLVSLVINKESDSYLRVKLDTENYRKRRQETLEALAKNIAYKVKRTRRSVSLEPMNPYERRIIHSALQNDKYVSTKSEGEEPFRHIVVFLKK